jgi:hypothetical protein
LSASNSHGRIIANKKRIAPGILSPSSIFFRVPNLHNSLGARNLVIIPLKKAQTLPIAVLGPLCGLRAAEQGLVSEADDFAEEIS